MIHSAKPCVLLVDDSLTIRMNLGRALLNAGFSVKACDTQASALQALRSGEFALAILDVVLPDGNGVELLKKLKDNPAWARIPVIMLSTEADIVDRIRGLSKGADEYIGKPYDSMYMIRRACTLAGIQDPYDPLSALGAMCGCRVLVVDDSPTFLRAISEQLRRDNHDVVTAQAAEEALELLAVQAVDCILMDVVMPGIDGLEACRRIRKIPGCERTPIMLLTMLEDRSLRQRAIEAGANDFVMKSADLELLRIRLRGVLRKQRIEPQKGGTASAPVSSPSAPPGQRSLFDQVVAASGIPAAADAIEKLCVRAGIDAKRMSAADLARALPIIGEFLSGSMTKEEASRRTAAISALARLWSRSRSS